MVIIDTSVWIEHLKSSNVTLSTLIDDEEILVHPFVIVEIACGHIKKRKEIIDLLSRFPAPELSSNEEILSFISNEKLYGLGIGFVDINLLASALLSGAKLWTRDKALKKIAAALHIDFNNQ